MDGSSDDGQELGGDGIEPQQLTVLIFLLTGQQSSTTQYARCKYSFKHCHLAYFTHHNPHEFLALTLLKIPRVFQKLWNISINAFPIYIHSLIHGLKGTR